MIREIVMIDEEKCDGCGLCVPSCHEGAIRIINGKARLVADNLCDGLGACLGHCPQGAIRVEKREAADFDERAVENHLGKPATPRPIMGLPMRDDRPSPVQPASVPAPSATTPHPGHAHAGGCPSQRFARLNGPAAQTNGAPAKHVAPSAPVEAGSGNSELTQWPVQLQLLPPRAPMFQNADLLLAADCVPFALPDFHQRLLQGRALAIACPKLDDTGTYVPKLTEIIAANSLRSITVVHMEVPCCTGILIMAMQARENAGADIPIHDVVISVRGEVIRQREISVESKTL